jgi:hypothetical protein
MDGKAFESLIYENASGNRVILSDRSVSANWELVGRSGFSAPEVELITQKYINGQEKIVGRIIKPRTVSINMVVTGATTAQRDALFFDMVDKLINVGGGEIGKLWITRSDGSVVYLNCAYSSGLKVVEQYRKFHLFTLEFYAENPYFYSQDIVQDVELVESSEPITLSDDLYLNGWKLDWAMSGGVNMVTNPYTHQADPIYKISGVRVNLTILNSTISKSLQFDDLDMALGDAIVIDTRERQRSAYIEHPDGSVTDILGNLLWSNVDLSLPLAPGNNYLSVSSLGEAADLEISISMTALSA